METIHSLPLEQRPVALVTGASRGIGRAIAIRLGRDGYRVVVNYLRSAQAADEVAEELTSLKTLACAIQGDVGQTVDRQRLMDETLAKYGRLDVLVNNAGITSPGRRDMLEATEESWDTVFATNLKGPFFLAQLVAREMIRLRSAGIIARGTLVNISSISSMAASSNRADYCIAKAGMGMLTWLFADRLAEHNVRVYEICPGVIASDMTAPVEAKYDQLIAAGLSPIRRWGQPDDVASAVSALVSGAFPFSTGERIHVDGGWHIRRL